MVVLVGQGQELEKDASSRGSSGTPGDQELSNMEKAGMKETQLVAGDRMGNAGADFMHMRLVEGKLQLETLKNMLISIKEEAVRWLGLIDLGLVRDKAMIISGPV